MTVGGITGPVAIWLIRVFKKEQKSLTFFIVEHIKQLQK